MTDTYLDYAAEDAVTLLVESLAGALEDRLGPVTEDAVAGKLRGLQGLLEGHQQTQQLQTQQLADTLQLLPSQLRTRWQEDLKSAFGEAESLQSQFETLERVLMTFAARDGEQAALEALQAAVAGFAPTLQTAIAIDAELTRGLLVQTTEGLSHEVKAVAPALVERLERDADSARERHTQLCELVASVPETTRDHLLPAIELVALSQTESRQALEAMLRRQDEQQAQVSKAVSTALFGLTEAGSIAQQQAEALAQSLMNLQAACQREAQAAQVRANQDREAWQAELFRIKQAIAEVETEQRRLFAAVEASLQTGQLNTELRLERALKRQQILTTVGLVAVAVVGVLTVVVK